MIRIPAVYDKPNLYYIANDKQKTARRVCSDSFSHSPRKHLQCVLVMCLDVEVQFHYFKMVWYCVSLQFDAEAAPEPNPIPPLNSIRGILQLLLTNPRQPANTPTTKAPSK